MMMRFAAGCLALALAAPVPLSAQQIVVDGREVRQEPALEVRTFKLLYIESVEAAKFIEPYIVSPTGQVRAVGVGGMRAVTVREVPRVLARIDSVLKSIDKPAATVRLRFQLIAAQEEQTARDPRIADLDATLRDLFRFGGYRLLAQTVVLVGEFRSFSQTFSADDDLLLLSGRMFGVNVQGDSGRISLDVTLFRPTIAATGGQGDTDIGQRILSTGLQIPLGQTVVLGSGVTEDSTGALILVVTPEVDATVGRR